MPNTLAHIALNGFVSKRIFKESDLLWIYTGCIIPDIPWMIQKIASILFAGINGYDLKSYAIAQATLFLSLVLSAAIASISQDFRRVISILCLGVLLHLALDSLQIKWANGIHLLAPISWEMLNFNLFWPENILTYILTTAGFLFFLLNIKGIFKAEWPLKINFNKLLVFIPALILYFGLPLLLLKQIDKNDVHFLSTLRNREMRVGKYVELDRKNVFYIEKTDSYWIEAYNGDIIELTDLPKINSNRISVKGKFLNKDLIQVIDYKENWALFRDGSSYIGIFLILAGWIYVYLKKLNLFAKRRMV